MMDDDEEREKWLEKVATRARELSDESLLEKFAEKVSRVRAEDSGLVIHIGFGGDRDYLKIYRAELLRRLAAARVIKAETART